MFIRAAHLEDASQLLPLMKHLGYSPTLEELKVSLSKCLSLSIYRYLVAEIEGHAVGACAFIIYPLCYKAANRASLEILIVDEEHRNQGIASNLLAECEKIAVDEQCSSIVLTSNKGREKSIYEFYHKRGYKNEWKNAQWYLKKSLQ